MELTNVTTYMPNEKKFGEGVIYFQSEDGTDFYDALGKFTLKYKLLIDSEGIIRACTEDASGLYPAGFSVVEIDELPDGFDIYGNWQYADGVISAAAIDYAAKAESTRSSLLATAKSSISLWQSELMLGTISDDDKTSLTNWITYIKALNALDFSGVTDEASYEAIEWPDAPENQ